MFAKAILVGAFAALAAAQSTVLSFTRVPNPVTAGQPQAITYSTNDTSSPVTILLRKGPSTDLQTVSTLTTTATDGQYIWTPSDSLENASDYALQITQGTQFNYYGPFSIQGASGSSSSSSSSSASASSSSHSASGYPSSSSSAVATITASYNSSAITTATISMGTGISVSRNTTMSRATLTGSSSMKSNSASATASTSGAGFQGSETGSASTPASTGGAATIASSALALLFGAVAAVLFC